MKCGDDVDRRRHQFLELEPRRRLILPIGKRPEGTYMETFIVKI